MDKLINNNTVLFSFLAIFFAGFLGVCVFALLHFLPGVFGAFLTFMFFIAMGAFLLRVLAQIKRDL